MIAIDWQPSHATLRRFGLALVLVLCARGIWCWTQSATAAGAVHLAAAVAVGSLATWRPHSLRMPYVLLGLLAYPARLAISFTALAALYFAVITPVAIGVRFVRQLRARRSGTHSHWHAADRRPDKASYFRQF